MLDLLLAFYLVLVMPSQQLWRSLRKQPQVKTRMYNYGRNCAIIGALLLLLLASSLVEGHSMAALGLPWPLEQWEQWTTGGIALGLFAIHLVGKYFDGRMDPAKRGAEEAKLFARESLPRTQQELGAFLVMSLFIGFGWEVLYRGFLLLVLTPYLGAAGAIAVAALAYGVGHGFENWRQLIASIVSALVFTLAYYYSQSLWWLIVFHTGVGILMGIGAYAVLSRPVATGPARQPLQG